MTSYEFHHYLPVNDDVMRWGLYVTGGGRGVIPPQSDYPPQEHPPLYQFNWRRGRVLPEFQIILITDGRGVFESEAVGKVAVNSNTLILLFPDVWHRYRPDEATGWKERWISLNGDMLHRMVDDALLRPKQAVNNLPHTNHILSLFDQLLNRIHEKPATNSIILSLHSMALTGEVVELISNGQLRSGARPEGYKSISNDALVTTCLDLIWTHSHLPLSVDYLVQKLHTSRRTLERRFSQACGHSIHSEIVRCRLSRAKRLLCETRLSVKSIAHLSGFASSQRMCVTFRKHLQTSPGRYRQTRSAGNLYPR